MVPLHEVELGDEDDEKGERQSRDDKRGITLRDEQNARVELRMYDEAAVS